MADLISRAAAIDEVEQWAEHGYDVVHWTGIKAMLEVQPAVDAAPVVHARWRKLKDDLEECTNCLGLCPHEENYNGDIIFNFGCEYCPWCGAKMDGDA
jgi:hypothetical protein